VKPDNKVERIRQAAERRGFERGICSVCTAAGLSFPDVPEGQQGMVVVKLIQAKARRDEANWWNVLVHSLVTWCGKADKRVAEAETAVAKAEGK
jgi:hypothetical protein